MLTNLVQAKEYLANPDAFAVAAPVAAAEEAAPAAAAKEEEKKEEEEGSDDDMVSLSGIALAPCIMLTSFVGLWALRLSELLLYFVLCYLLYLCTSNALAQFFQSH